MSVARARIRAFTFHCTGKSQKNTCTHCAGRLKKNWWNLHTLARARAWRSVRIVPKECVYVHLGRNKRNNNAITVCMRTENEMILKISVLLELNLNNMRCHEPAVSSQAIATATAAQTGASPARQQKQEQRARDSKRCRDMRLRSQIHNCTRRLPTLVSDPITLTFRALRRNHIVSTTSGSQNKAQNERGCGETNRQDLRTRGREHLQIQIIVTKYVLKHRRAPFHATH